MKIYALGIDPAWLTLLREHKYHVTGCQTLPDEIGQSILITTSKEFPISDLANLRERHPQSEIIYMWMEKGIAGWQTPAAICESLGIRFVRPGIGKQSFIEQLNAWFRTNDKASNLIGVFGSLPGVGVTRIASTIANLISQGKKVIMLGLNLYNAGWEEGASISLDRWRQRLIANVLQPEDLSQLLTLEGFHYLPGNEDMLSVLDYEEREIEHLLAVAQTEADVVIADFGAIPESAAWLCGIQQSAIRIMVTHPSHTKRLSSLMKLSNDMGIPSEHWFVLSNRTGSEDVSLKTIAHAHRMQPLYSFPYKGQVNQFILPSTDREKDLIRKACQPIFTTVGIEQKEKRGWFNVLA